MPAHTGTVIVVCGPTAVGKTGFAIELAEQLGTEIISADSRQIYRELPIGTGQPSREQLARVRHHFIAERSINEDCNAGIFGRDSLSRLNELFRTHDNVIVCGGTGLYIKALCEGLDDMPGADLGIRDSLSVQLEKNGLEPLQKQLKQLDPVHYARMDIQNPQRVMRALEVCLSTCRPFSSFHRREKQPRSFRTVKVGLELPREEMYGRINRRTDMMLSDGWTEEAKAVFDQRHLNALNTVGYKELFAHLEGELSFEEATEKIKTSTARFAKRQLTWFRKDRDIHWFERPKVSDVEGLIVL